VLVPLTPGASERLPSNGRTSDTQRDRILWDLPLAIFDHEWPAYRDEVEQLITRGFRHFRLQNISQFMLFSDHSDLTLETGYRLFTTNSQAALAWQQLGVSCATLFVEDDRDNISELLRRDSGLTLAVTAYANLPMMVSRMPIHGVKTERPLLSDRGEGYRVESRKGLAVIRPEQDFSLLGHLEELRTLGCQRFIIDLAHTGPFSPRGRQVLTALRHDEALPDTSTFNYLQELT
jgi:putative protease